jgi:hypothetical protein
MQLYTHHISYYTIYIYTLYAVYIVYSDGGNRYHIDNVPKWKSFLISPFFVFLCLYSICLVINIKE